MPAPAPIGATPYGTPISATATAEGGAIQSYAFAEKAGELSSGAPSFTTGATTFAVSLAGTQAFAGAALRVHAPGNDGVNPGPTFNAAPFSKLRLQLQSGTDALLTIKLQPATVAADGCTATAQAVVSAASAEIVIDLNDSAFVLPDYCAGQGTPLAGVKPAIFAVDVINPATAAGAHDLTVGSVSFGE